MFLLFERQKDFFEFEMEDPSTTKKALIIAAGVILFSNRSGCCSLLFVCSSFVDW